MLTAFISSALALSIVVTYLTNPFVRFSIIRRPFRAKLHRQMLEIIDENQKLKVRSNWFWKAFAIYQCGLYILSTRYLAQKKSNAKTVDGVIEDIHKLRFNPDKLLLISGDHFNGLFVRNLGVFYYPMLDRAIPSSESDWQNRQTVYLQSVAYGLGAFAKSPKPVTTLVSTGRLATTPVNFYRYPSDTVFGILYALSSLVGIESGSPHDYNKPLHQLDTKEAAQDLITAYMSTLQALYQDYSETVYDQSTGLIKQNLHLSGAKDITRRSCAFYDNVIYWKTTQLAMKLGVIKPNYPELKRLKKRIIDSFWHEELGHFLEDLSEEGLANDYYSSDWIICLSTGFLDPLDDKESHYYQRSFEYIEKHGINQPFGLKYQQSTRAERQFFAVRLAVASYGGDAIWSFWGMEYIKALTLIYKKTGNKHYQTEAKRNLDAYEQSMLRYGGFPEVYDPNGDLLQTPMYKSILMTGWVIGFEQARSIYQAIK